MFIDVLMIFDRWFWYHNYISIDIALATKHFMITGKILYTLMVLKLTDLSLEAQRSFRGCKRQGAANIMCMLVLEKNNRIKYYLENLTVSNWWLVTFKKMFVKSSCI
jgi:hypothetical protein